MVYTMLCDVMWYLYWWVNSPAVFADILHVIMTTQDSPGMTKQTKFAAVLHVIIATLARQTQDELHELEE